MKVVCETCEARYQIPDERVAGRRLRIRCRKCGGVMEARGDELVASTPVVVASGGAEWFTSIDGTPIGPLSTDDIVSRITTGVLDWDAHVWREGYAEWVTVDASDTLVRAVASSRSAVADEPRSDSTERTSIPPHARADGYESADAYARDERTLNEDAPTNATLEDSPTRVAYDETPTRMYSSHSAPPGVLPPMARSAFASRPPGTLPPITRQGLGESSPQMFSGGSHAPSNGGNGNGHGYASAPNHYSSAQLTGGPLPLPSAIRAPQSAPPVRAGFAGGEGSGLIDIRALASLAQTRMNVPQRSLAAASMPAAPVEEDVPDNDPLASFGTGHGVAFAALDSLAPAANREKPKDSTVPLAILTGAAMIGAAVFAALYITRAPDLAPPTVTAAQPTQELAAPAPSSAAQPGVAPTVPTPEPAAPEPAQATAPELAEPERPALAAKEQAEEKIAVAPKAIRAGGKRGAVARKAPVGTSAAAAEKADEEEEADPLELGAKTEKAPPPTVDDILLADDKPAADDKEPEVAAKPTKAPAGNRSIDDLLDVAVSKKAPTPTPTPTPAADASGAADSPTRADVLSAMRKIEGEVRACAANEATPVTGTANVAITVVGSTGKVTSAEVSGLTGPVGSCIARVARTATFAPFTRDRFSVTFPYRFK
jgi:predicted Zn finger-like uncharacterized protein